MEIWPNGWFLVQKPSIFWKLQDPVAMIVASAAAAATNLHVPPPPQAAWPLQFEFWFWVERSDEMKALIKANGSWFIMFFY